MILFLERHIFLLLCSLNTIYCSLDIYLRVLSFIYIYIKQMLPWFNHTQVTLARVLESQNVFGFATPPVIGSLLGDARNLICTVWFEQALIDTVRFSLVFLNCMFKP